MKKALLLLLTIPVISQSHAIIYRHDVAEEKYRALAQQPQFNCVGEVFDMTMGASPGGSCVLIGDRWVLSAAHVFVKSAYKHDTIMDGDKRIILNTPINRRIGDAGEYQFRFQRKMYAGKTIKVLPDYMQNGNYDIILIELAEPVKDITPAVLNKNFDEAGTKFTMAGFGVSGNAADAEDIGPYFNKLAGQNTIDSIGGANYNNQPTMLAFDFDHPTVKEHSTMGSTAALPLESLCGGGDSGGGMFRQRNDNWELIGICAASHTNIDKLLKSGYYSQEGSYTRVSAFYQWITENTTPAAAAHK